MLTRKDLTMAKDNADENAIGPGLDSLDALDDDVDLTGEYDPDLNYTKIFVRLSEPRAQNSSTTIDPDGQ